MGCRGVFSQKTFIFVKIASRHEEIAQIYFAGVYRTLGDNIPVVRLHTIDAIPVEIYR